MPTRYQVLRQVVANLAAPAEVQVAHLNRVFADCTPDVQAAYGNDELALEFEDAYLAVNHMRSHGEISQREIDALAPLNALLLQWSGEVHADFWRREALFNDDRWNHVRDCAKVALIQLPDEVRESDHTRGLPGNS